MNLRRLELSDGALMLEWMHDLEVVKDLNTDFRSKTIEDCETFIKGSWENTQENLHLAIVDDRNVYQGTVSLKEIDLLAYNAEFAITIRRCAMGRGLAISAMNSILNLGKERLGLKKIYWCVDLNNIRAVRFYDKNKFNRTCEVPKSILGRYSHHSNLIWYCWEA